MYSVSTEYNSAAEAMTRQILIKACFNDSVWLTGDDNLINMTVTEGVAPSDGISMGTTIASKLSMSFNMPESPIILSGGWVEPYVGFYGVDEYCPLGKFYITDVEFKNQKYTITAYDGFSKTETAYKPNIDMPNTAEAILTDIAEQCGFSIGKTVEFPTISDSILIMTNPPETDTDGILIFTEAPTVDDSGVLIINDELAYPEGEFDLYDYTCRQYIGYFAGFMGKNAKFNRNGKLVFPWYKDVYYNIPINLQYSDGLTKETDNDVTIYSITSGSEDNVMTSGSGIGISFDNPFMTQDQLDYIFENMITPVFTPATIKWRGNPALESSDIITIEDKNGATCKVFIMEQTIKISGGLYSEIKCYGNSDESINFSTSPQQKKLQQVYNKLQEAIAEATKLLKGSNGGIFEIIDEDNDGINDGWIIHTVDEQQHIKANVNGIGITTDGGATYEQAMTTKGINASVITTGEMNAQRISVGDSTLGDVFSVDTDSNGHPVVTIGASDSDIMQKQTNDAITFVDGEENHVAKFSITGAEWADMQEMKYCGFVWTKSEITGNVRFTKASEN